MASVICDHVFVCLYAPVHNYGMSHDIPTLLIKMMEALPGNQTQLAERLSERKGLKIVQPQISRWLKGQAPERPAYDRIVSVAETMALINDVRSEDVAAQLATRPEKRKAQVKGYVGAGSVAHFYALSDEDFEEVDAPLDATDQTIAVEIRGKSFGPLMDSWLVFYDDVRAPVTADLLNEICVVGLADDRILIKQIKSDGNGGYNLISNSGEDVIYDAEIEWAAKVTNMRPR
jgi:hypothetical protein